MMPAPAAATTLQPPTTDRRPSPGSTHRLPAHAPWWLAALVVATLLGFQRTLAKGPTGLDLAHAIHGTAALGWSLLLIVQAALAQNGRRRWHRMLAVPAIGCAIVMVASSVPMLRALATAASTHASFQPIGSRLWLMDVMLLALFVALFAVGMAHARNPVLHARAMAATGILALPAGLGRFYMNTLTLNPALASYLALATGAALLAAVIASDRRRGIRETVLPSALAACVAIAITTEFAADAAVIGTLLRLS